VIINIDLLREHLPRTYRTITRDLDLYRPSGDLDIDLNDARLGTYTRGELTGFAVAQKAQPAAPPPAPEPPKPAEPLPPQIDFAEVEAENKRDIQRRADEAAAKNRLQQLADEEGLEKTAANVEAIKQFLQQHLRGYLSAEGVNAAYQNLGPRGSNVLTFKKVQPPPAAPEAAPAGEVLEPWQLPLDADEHTMKRADVRALKDLLARRRAATGQQYIGRGARTNRLVSNF
jgi:hypothetical protein